MWIAFSRLARASREHHKLPKDKDLLGAMLQARIELAAFSRFADCIAVILVFLTIVYLAVGINFIKFGGKHLWEDKMIKRGSYGLSGILGGLAIAELALRVTVYTEFYRSDYDLDDDEEHSLKLLNIARKLDFSFVVIIWVLSIAMVLRAGQIWLTTELRQHIKFVSNGLAADDKVLSLTAY